MICRLVRLLYRLIPWHRWQAFLIAGHGRACPRCRADFSIPPEWRALGVTAATLPQTLPDLWPGIAAEIRRQRLCRRRQEDHLRRFRADFLRFFLILAVVLVLVGLTLFFIVHFHLQ